MPTPCLKDSSLYGRRNIHQLSQAVRFTMRVDTLCKHQTYHIIEEHEYILYSKDRKLVAQRRPARFAPRFCAERSCMACKSSRSCEPNSTGKLPLKRVPGIWESGHKDKRNGLRHQWSTNTTWTNEMTSTNSTELFETKLKVVFEHIGKATCPSWIRYQVL